MPFRLLPFCLLPFRLLKIKEKCAVLPTQLKTVSKESKECFLSFYNTLWWLGISYMLSNQNFCVFVPV